MPTNSGDCPVLYPKQANLTAATTASDTNDNKKQINNYRIALTTRITNQHETAAATVTTITYSPASLQCFSKNLDTYFCTAVNVTSRLNQQLNKIFISL